VYVTNAVKHFYFGERGRARIHKKPRQRDVKACNPWLRSELETIRPDLLLLLGSTAAQAVLGPRFRVTQERGKPLASDLAPVVIATAHPSSVLRAPDDASRHEAYRLLVSDLEVAARELRTRAGR
jgi:uracil-DNA glycosylase